MKSETVTFKDQSPSYSYKVDALNDATFSVSDSSDADLNSFFSRPIKIQEYDWATGTAPFNTFDPWSLYFSNPRVINRISNYNLLRAKLCLKFMINGNGFHYGRMIASYIPLRTIDQFTVNRTNFNQDLIGASQRPHVYLDPTTSQGGTMCLPFVWYDNYLSVPASNWNLMGTMVLQTMQALEHANGAADGATISVFAWAEDVHFSMPTSAEPGALLPQMGKEDDGCSGKCYSKVYVGGKPFNELSPIRRVLKAPPTLPEETPERIITSSPMTLVSGKDNCGNTIVASTTTEKFSNTDITLTKVTGKRPRIVVSNLPEDEMHYIHRRLRELILCHEEREFEPQMGTEDEYGTGPVSRPATIVERAAGKLSSVPYIGAYARATELAAGAIASVARTYGYSRPNELAASRPYRHAIAGNLANTNVDDTCTKLSCDAKQELTVDPTTIGVGATDEMTIKSIACRESYVTQFPWTVGTPPEDMLFQCVVTPAIWDVNPITTPPEMHLPPCAFAAFPFKYWRGSMKYRFQVVSSNYHKGRLKIVYDPHGFQSNEYNTNYTYIVDIAEEKDFTVEIGWGSHLPYCLVGAPGENDSVTLISDTTLPFGTTNAPVVPSNFGNGVIRVYVVNKLTVPNDTVVNDINVNFFVACGDDIEFRDPSDNINNFQYFPQMGLESGHEAAEGDNDDTEEPSKPMDQQIDLTMAKTLPMADAYDHVFFGESIVSFRSLLKRYSYHTSEVPEFVPGRFKSKIVRAAFPYYKGLAPGAIQPGAQATPYNYAHNTLMNYLTPAFTGWRGGIRYKIVYSEPDRQSTGYLQATRVEDSGFYDNDSVGLPILGDLQKFMAIQRPSTLTGSAITTFQMNPALEVELPFSANKRFAPAKLANWTTPFTFFGEDFNIQALRVEGTHEVTGISRPMYDMFVSAGEDFSLFFFTGCPIMYYNVVPP